MKIQACRVIFLIFLGLLSQVASAQPADRNTCNGEVARFQGHQPEVRQQRGHHLQAHL